MYVSVSENEIVYYIVGNTMTNENVRGPGPCFEEIKGPSPRSTGFDAYDPKSTHMNFRFLPVSTAFQSIGVTETVNERDKLFNVIYGLIVRKP